MVYASEIHLCSALLQMLSLERFCLLSGLGNKSSSWVCLVGYCLKRVGGSPIMEHKSRNLMNQGRACGHSIHEEKSQYCGRSIGKERQMDTKLHLTQLVTASYTTECNDHVTTTGLTRQQV